MVNEPVVYVQVRTVVTDLAGREWRGLWATVPITDVRKASDVVQEQMGSDRVVAIQLELETVADAVLSTDRVQPEGLIVIRNPISVLVETRAVGSSE